MTPSGVTRRRDLPLDGRAIDRNDFGRGQPLELADLAIDPRHSLPRYSRRRPAGRHRTGAEAKQRPAVGPRNADRAGGPTPGRARRAHRSRFRAPRGRVLERCVLEFAGLWAV